ncbi:hypothetical protein IWQ60_001817 [Tieghemiomyces parasiticus]|uniref:Rab-GAP TBC domain-containing protein n=1 Tax=Tieghemiomyces parasiticus TaxID=78921 RepID=A0A9W8AJ71_9FUNG|nr:hypothetical protein IWQ60_001817 [Tieghemiomyces parasiticus]
MSLTTLREQGLATPLAERHLRSISWKLYLEYLPGLSDVGVLWPEALHKERTHYQRLYDRYVTEPSRQLNPATEPDRDRPRSASPDVDLRVYNPLSLAEDSPWQLYFQDTELRSTIQKDVERTFPDQPCFARPEARTALTDILFVYCKLHPDTSYRQGMHELLAPLWKTVWEESVALAEDNPDTSTDAIEAAVFQALDANYVQHDAFALFTRVMRVARSWFEISEVATNATANLRTRNPGSAGGARSPPVSDSLRHLKINELSRATPILAKCNNVFFQLLKRVDPSLFTHLEQLEIEPQLFGIRWIRLLWGREFPFDDLHSLWTALFADDPNLGAVDWVCVAMLLRVRRTLLNGDYATCLQTLMRYPALMGPASAPAMAAPFPPFPHLPNLQLTGLAPTQFLFQQAIYLRSHFHAAAGQLVAAQNDALLGIETINEPLPPVETYVTSPSLPAHPVNSRSFPSPRTGTGAGSPVPVAREALSAGSIPPVATPTTTSRSTATTVARRASTSQSAVFDSRLGPPAAAILEQCEAWLHQLATAAPTALDTSHLDTVLPLVMETLRYTRQILQNDPAAVGRGAGSATPSQLLRHLPEHLGNLAASLGIPNQVEGSPAAAFPQTHKPVADRVTEAFERTIRAPLSSPFSTTPAGSAMASARSVPLAPAMRSHLVTKTAHKTNLPTHSASSHPAGQRTSWTRPSDPVRAKSPTSTNAKGDRIRDPLGAIF